MRSAWSLRESVTLVLVIVVLTWLVTPGLEAAPSLWPANKGERCWLDAEGILTRAHIQKMAGNHYLIHGAVIRPSDPPPFDVQPFSGNVELVGSLAIGQIVKFQVNDVADPPPEGAVLEAFSGIFWIQLATLDGTAEGIISTCDREPVPNSDCAMRNDGPSVMIPTPCP